jgi:hypothetical protein
VVPHHKYLYVFDESAFDQKVDHLIFHFNLHLVLCDSAKKRFEKLQEAPVDFFLYHRGKDFF